MSGSPGGTRLPSHGSFDTRVPPPSRALATPDAPPDAGGPRPAVEFSEATGPTPKRRRSGSLPGESADAEPDSFGRIDLDATDDAGAADSGGDDAGGESAAGPLLTHNLSVKMGAEPEADSELLTPERSSTEARRRVLGVSALVAVTFFNVSGGPVGAESIFAAGGPALGIIGLLVFPWLWAVPVSLIVAELSSSMPTDGGYTVWVTQAFGPYWGFQEGYWSWLSGVVDNALYPVLAVDMIEQLTGVEYHWTVGYAIKLSATVTFTYVNMRGVEIVGRLLEALCVITMLPFLLLCLWGIPQMEWSRLGIFAEPGQWNWGLWLGTLFWNFNGFDGTSTFAGEVRDPTRTYPRAMFLSVVVISLAYLLPLCVAAGVDKPAWSTWDDGSFVAIAQNIGGDWLGYTVIVSSIMGGIGLFTTELFVDSFQLLGMAELNLAPKIFKWRHPKYNTPWPAILASALLISGLVMFDFDSILAIDNCLSATSLLLELIAAVKLRFMHKDMHRPYKVPVGDWGLLALLAGPCGVTIGIVVAAMTTSWASMGLSLGSVAVGLLLGVRQARIYRAAQTESP